MAAYADSMLNTLARAWEIAFMVGFDKAPKVFLIKPCSIVNILRFTLTMLRNSYLSFPGGGPNEHSEQTTGAARPG